MIHLKSRNVPAKGKRVLEECSGISIERSLLLFFYYYERSLLLFFYYYYEAQNVQLSCDLRVTRV
ncbi:MAG: hypothetical protein ACI86P_002682 [Flavobacteriales bacterium]|jgi:hypothetical protein